MKAGRPFLTGRSRKKICRKSQSTELYTTT
nr:MAG TPA: hypothetical protein [Caudoviricetes sp.]